MATSITDMQNEVREAVLKRAQEAEAKAGQAAAAAIVAKEVPVLNAGATTVHAVEPTTNAGVPNPAIGVSNVVDSNVVEADDTTVEDPYIRGIMQGHVA